MQELNKREQKTFEKIEAECECTIAEEAEVLQVKNGTKYVYRLVRKGKIYSLSVYDRKGIWFLSLLNETGSGLLAGGRYDQLGLKKIIDRLKIEG